MTHCASMEFLNNISLKNLEKKWIIRRPTDTYDREEYYSKYPSRICIRIHHGGVFTSFPGRRYVGGKVNHFDLVEPDMISVIDLDRMHMMLGYTIHDTLYYQFLIPGQGLDYGLRPLSSDAEMAVFSNSLGGSRLVDIYTEIGRSKCVVVSPKKPCVQIIEIEDEPIVSCKRKLFLEWYPSEAETSNAGPSNVQGEGVHEDIEDEHQPMSTDIRIEEGETDITAEEGQFVSMEAGNEVDDGNGLASNDDGTNTVNVEELEAGNEVDDGNGLSSVDDGTNNVNDVRVEEVGSEIRVEEVGTARMIVEEVESPPAMNEVQSDLRNEEVHINEHANVNVEEHQSQTDVHYENVQVMNEDARDAVDPMQVDAIPDEELNALFDNFDPFEDVENWTPNEAQAANLNPSHTESGVDGNQMDRPVDMAVDEPDTDVASHESDDSNDTDYVVEDNVNTFQEHLRVDMVDFLQNTDREAEWVPTGETSVDENLPNMDFVLSLDNDDLISADDEDSMDVIWRRNVKKTRYIAKKHAVDEGVPCFYVGQVFGSKSGLREDIVKLALVTRRDVRVVKNDSTRIRAVCLGVTLEEGQSSGVGEKNECEKVEKLKDSPSGSGKCPWVLYLSKQKNEPTWMVKTFVDKHCCSNVRSVPSATAEVLSREITHIVKDNPTIKIETLQRQIEKDFQIELSRQKAFRAKQLALNQIRGDFAMQYNRLRDYILELQRTNPGTTIKLDFERNTPLDSMTRQFRRIYVCLGALKEGFKAGKRDLLGLDGAFMKGPFPGQLLTAVGIDGNNGIFPLAYAIVEAETYNSWTWFLENLGYDLELATNSNFTFISDRQKGLIPALATLFPAAEHRYCVRHIHENMKKLGWKGEAFLRYIWNIATATTTQEFSQHMNELHEYSKPAYNYLAEIPPTHWARSHFTGRCHSDVVLNNMCESFNAQLIDARDKPIITALEFVREYLTKRMCIVQETINKCRGPLTPWCAARLEEIKKEATKYQVLFNGDAGYQVTGPWHDQQVVDMRLRSCTCRTWEITGIPCKHAVATFWDMRKHNMEVSAPEHYVHECYNLHTWKAMYAHKIQGTLGPKQWPVSAVPIKITPPVHRTQYGRPKKRRMKSLEETDGRPTKLTRRGKTVTCDLCKQPGHNSRTCKGQRPQGPSTKSRTSSRGGTGVARKKAAGSGVAHGSEPNPAGSGAFPTSQGCAGPSVQGSTSTGRGTEAFGRGERRKFKPSRGRGVGHS